MKIEVPNIPKSGMTIEEDEPPEIMEGGMDGVVHNEPIHVKFSVNLVGRTLVIRGRLTSTVVVECSRCLKRFNHPVHVADYTYAREVKPDETVDLTGSIREDIIISLPMKRLCSPDCKGLCPVCGQDLNLSVCGCHRSSGLSSFSCLDRLKP